MSLLNREPSWHQLQQKQQQQHQLQQQRQQQQQLQQQAPRESETTSQSHGLRQGQAGHLMVSRLASSQCRHHSSRRLLRTRVGSARTRPDTLGFRLGSGPAAPNHSSRKLLRTRVTPCPSQVGHIVLSTWLRVSAEAGDIVIVSSPKARPDAAWFRAWTSTIIDINQWLVKPKPGRTPFGFGLAHCQQACVPLC